MSKTKVETVPESNRPTVEQLAQEMMDNTKPVPGFEDAGLRYAGSAQMGYFPCVPNGAVMVSNCGSPIIWPSLAHLRAWAHNHLMQKSNIVIPTGGMPTPQGRPN